MGLMEYEAFLESKVHSANNFGFSPIWLPDFLYDFQRDLVEWAIRSGRAAIFADCGLGKTPMQLVWAENIVRKTNKNILILTPLAVSQQTVKEAEKFNIEINRSKEGKIKGKITVTNYERLEYFNSNDFVGVVCDESSILKNYDGKRRNTITNFLRKMPYRLLCTATAAPNDYIELGTSSEALGVMGYIDMLGRFFKNDQNTIDTKSKWRIHNGMVLKWRFKKHAEIPFWKWVCTWARAIRKPSDIGYSDGNFILPKLIERETVIHCSRPLPGRLFAVPAQGLHEQRQERRMTIKERCNMAAEKTKGKLSALIWCHLNDEGDLLEKIIPDAKQVKGSDSDDKKEDLFTAFSDGSLRVLITKPKIGAFGMNWQHCSYITFFPSHSYEQYYQGVRRCWRFGQKNPVIVDIITSEGEYKVLKNLQRKSEAADKMFSELALYMFGAMSIKIDYAISGKVEVPTWIKS